MPTLDTNFPYRKRNRVLIGWQRPRSIAPRRLGRKSVITGGGTFAAMIRSAGRTRALIILRQIASN
jgi:hypothetical protein